MLVLNGSGLTGHAGDTSAALTAAGFGAAGTGEEERFDVTEPLVRYTSGSEAKADLVARYLDPSARLELVDGELGADVVVVTGSLLAGVRTEPRPPGPSTTATTTTSTTVVDGTSTSTTSTTVVGYVPRAPDGVDC